MKQTDSPRRKRGIGYGRVSSRGQEDNCSLETQERAIREYAKRQGYELVDFVTEAETAIDENLGARPVLSSVRQRLRIGEADVLLIYKVDRVFRNQFQPAALLPELRQHGASLEFVLERFEDTTIGRFSLQAMAFAAEIEAAAIKERTMRGRRDSLFGLKRLPPAPKPLYGYLWVREQNRKGDRIIVAYAIDPVTSAIVLRIFREYASGKTLRRIATELTRDKIPTPSGNGNSWSYVKIRQIVQDERYTGEAYGWRNQRVRNIKGRPTVRSRPRDEQAPLPKGTVPPIVDHVTYKTAQRRLIHNRESAPRNNKSPQSSLLRGGFVRCAYCHRQDGQGRTMVVANANKHRPALYRCVAACAQTILIDLLDREVWAHVAALLTNPQIVLDYIRARASTPDAATAELHDLQRTIRETEREQKQLTENLGLVKDAAAVAVAARLNVVAETVASLHRQETAITARVEVYRAYQARLTDIERHIESIVELAVPVGLARLTTEQRRTILFALGLQVDVRRPNDPYINGRRYAIRMNLAPFPSGDCGSHELWYEAQFTLPPGHLAVAPARAGTGTAP